MPTQTIRIKIVEDHVNHAVKLAEEGMPSGDVLVYSDASTPGLQLRVQGKKAFWVLKYFKFTKTIAFAYPVDKRKMKAPTEARKLAAACKEILDDDPAMLEPFLIKRFGTSGDNKTAKREMRPEVTTWTLQQCCDAVIQERRADGAEFPIGEESVEEWRRTLRRPQMKDVVNKPVAKLSRGDFDSIRRDIEKEYGLSPSKKAISNVRTILSYCCAHFSKESGLDHRDQWWEMMKSGKKIKARKRRPGIDDIAKTLILAEKYLHEPLPGRQDGKRGVRENVFAALWWLVLTGQRTFAGLCLLRRDLFPDPHRPGWWLAGWGEDIMKMGIAHTIPVPPRVAEYLQPLIENARFTGSEWAFPSDRGGEIPVNRSSVLAVLERLGARDAYARQTKKRLEQQAKKEKERAKLGDGTKKKRQRKQKPVDCLDLLTAAGIKWWTPHDLRRSLTKVMDDEGIPGGASAILAHELKLSDNLNEDELSPDQKEEWQAQRMAKITKLAYGGGQHMQLKSRAMEAWTDAVLDAYERLSGKNVVQFKEAAE
ncbi:integrase [Sinorhizobium fredii]